MEYLLSTLEIVNELAAFILFHLEFTKWRFGGTGRDLSGTEG